jgi:hypothetical protein
MTEKFEFDLIFTIPSKGTDQGEILDALFEAGCDDAVVGIGTPGSIALSFSRSGEGASGVISEATKAALSALPQGAKLREVTPDLLGSVHRS